ncbi:uncharacterized protein [Elaeis guineensis]|uniref:Uncharacterized protein LOC114912647 n=1 Tax=Elaeis guineensis var. tenera TaxID=51953 RepID=A0A8N4I544_ELAGV|nr:uncharacterized protein LOC114912647 [Elaeis guineensis]
MQDTVHILLDFSNHSIERRNPLCHCQNILSFDIDGLHLLIGDTSKLSNIIESSAVGPIEKPPHRTNLSARSLHNLDHGNLRLCTENLNFESYNNSGIGIEEIRRWTPKEDDQRLEAQPWGRRRRPRWWRAEAKFSPPLPWLIGWDGWRSQFMRVVREDGWIILTMIQIERPEVLHTSRREEKRRGQGMK